MTFVVKKLGSLGYHVALFAWSFSLFDTIPACDTQTDRQTHHGGYYPRIASATRV